MTISSIVNKNQYTGDGTTTTFTYTFRIITSSDIRVVLTNTTTGVDTVQVITSNYTVTGANNPGGGTIVFGVAPATGLRITLMRNAQALQPEHYVENDPFPAASHEIALDRVTTVSQTVQEQVGRAIQVGYGTSSAFDNVLPPIGTANAGQAILVAPDLSGFEFGNTSYVSGPTSSTDNAVARFDGITGAIIQNSLVTIDDVGALVAPDIGASTATINTLTTTNETVSGTLTAATANIVNLASTGTFTANTATITDVNATNVNANTITGVSYGVINATTINNSGTVTTSIAIIDDVEAKNITINPTAGVTGQLKFIDVNGVKYVAFRSPDNVTASTIYKLPPIDGVPGQVLTTDGLGNLTWETGVPQPPFLGTLASLADVAFLNLIAGNVFVTPNGSMWSNPAIGMFSGFEPYSINISLTNVAETRSQNIDMANNQLARPLLKQDSELLTTVTASPTTTLDISTANVFALDQAVDTTLTFGNPTATGSHCSFTLLRRKDNSATIRAVTWPASVKWAEGVIPTLTQTANAVDAYFFRTINGGTSWLGYLATADFA